MTAALKILHYPHRALREPTFPVLHFDDALRHDLQQMLSLMYAEDAVGLASTQVGLTTRLFVMDVSPQQTQPQCFINPEIIAQEGDKLCEEACASFVGVYAKVRRAEMVSVKYHNAFGEELVFHAKGLAAHCIQHELDHLNGILFIDRLSKLKRMMVLRKLEKCQRAVSQ